MSSNHNRYQPYSHPERKILQQLERDIERFNSINNVNHSPSQQPLQHQQQLVFYPSLQNQQPHQQQDYHDPLHQQQIIFQQSPPPLQQIQQPQPPQQIMYQQSPTQPPVYYQYPLIFYPYTTPTSPQQFIPLPSQVINNHIPFQSPLQLQTIQLPQPIINSQQLVQPQQTPLSLSPRGLQSTKLTPLLEKQTLKDDKNNTENNDDNYDDDSNDNDDDNKNIGVNTRGRSKVKGESNSKSRSRTRERSYSRERNDIQRRRRIRQRSCSRDSSDNRNCNDDYNNDNNSVDGSIECNDVCSRSNSGDRDNMDDECSNIEDSYNVDDFDDDDDDIDDTDYTSKYDQDVDYQLRAKSLIDVTPIVKPNEFNYDIEVQQHLTQRKQLYQQQKIAQLHLQQDKIQLLIKILTQPSKFKRIIKEGTMQEIDHEIKMLVEYQQNKKFIATVNLKVQPNIQQLNVINHNSLIQYFKENPEKVDRFLQLRISNDLYGKAFDQIRLQRMNRFGNNNNNDNNNLQSQQQHYHHYQQLPKPILPPPSPMPSPQKRSLYASSSPSNRSPPSSPYISPIKLSYQEKLLSLNQELSALLSVENQDHTIEYQQQLESLRQQLINLVSQKPI